MKHKIHGETRKPPYIFRDVELFPDNETEQKAITNVRNLTGSQEEKELIENYMLFRLGAITVEWQRGNRAILKCSSV